MGSTKYDIERIRKYLNGDLGEREMYELERQAQDDPILMDLMTGLELAGSEPIHRANLDEIRRRVEQHVGQGGKVRTWIPAWGKWAAAASILLVAGIGVFLVWRPMPESMAPMKPDNEVLTNFDRQDEYGAEELVAAEMGETPSQDPAGAEVERQMERRVSRPADAKGGISKDKLASITRPQPVPSDYDIDAVLIPHVPSANRSDDDVAGMARAETTLLAGRSAIGANEGKRLSMSIRSLPVNQAVPSLYREVSGVVREKDSGKPLSGVSILGVNKQLYTQSGADGKFSLVLPDNQDSLTLASAGYQIQTVGIPRHDSFVVLLATTPSVRGSSLGMDRGYPNLGFERLRDTTSGKPRPIGGWTEFDRYVKQETNASEGTGMVTLKFKIGVGGQPISPQLEHTTNPALVKKAMDILLKGPRWEQGKEHNGLATVLIEFH